MGVALVYALILAMALKFNKKIEETAPVAIFSVVALIYIPGIFLDLMPGLYASIVMIGVSFVYCIYKFITDKGNVVRLITSPASIALILFILFFAYFSIGRGFINTDDQIAWGRNVKGLYMYHELKNENYTGTLVYYPLGNAIWEFFAVMTWRNYAEGIVLWAYNVYVVSLMLPIFAIVNKKNKIVKTLILTLFVLLLLLSATEDAFVVLQSDTLFTMLFTYSIYLIYRYIKTFDMFYFVSIILNMFVLCLCKRLGIVFCMLSIFVAVYMLARKRYSDNVTLKNKILLIIDMTLVSMLAYLHYIGFSVYIIVPIIGIFGGIIFAFTFDNWNNKNVKYSFIILMIVVILAALKIEFLRTDFNKSVTLGYINNLFIPAEGCEFGHSITFSFGIVLVVSFMTWYFIRKKDDSLETKIFVPLFISLILYWIILCVVYIEMIAPSYGGTSYGDSRRYLIQLYIPLVLYFVYYFFKRGQDKSKECFFVLLATMIVVEGFGNLSDYMLNKYEQAQYNGFEDAGIELELTDKVMYIDTGNKEDTVHTSKAFYYYIFPGYSEFRIGSEITTDNQIVVYGCETSEELSSYLIENEYDYVYIQIYSEALENTFGELFGDSEVKGGGVYKVIINDNEVTLELLN